MKDSRKITRFLILNLFLQFLIFRLKSYESRTTDQTTQSTFSTQKEDARLLFEQKVEDVL